ncbi:MAG: transposase [Bacteroidales bacterium]|nr:transposase [Bacteroidales bacterium]
MKYYFLSSSHLENRIWFRDDEDFKAGMNFVALAAAHCGVALLVFVLMSNHVHFLLAANYEMEAREFFSYFKKVYSQYLNRKYRTLRFLRENVLDCQEVSALKEHLERVIAYILMNPVAANIVLHPVQYPWGCGNCFFTARNLKGRKVGSMGYRERRRILHSHQSFGENNILGEDGYILPESFVRKDMVEAIFRTPNRLNYFLNNSSKARKVLESENGMLPSFQDKCLVIMTRDICASLFRKTELSDLTDREKKRLVYELHRRSGADLKQLSRVLEMSPAYVAEILSQL